jgi:hypothetical protein
MRRFYFGDEGHEEDDEADEMDFVMPESGFITMTPMDNPEHYLLGCAIKLCENSIFWRFLDNSTRLKMIEEAYKTFRQLTEGNDDAKI